MHKLKGLVTCQQHIDSKIYQWALDNILHEQKRYHRKQWEVVYILQMLQLAGKLKPGKLGIGFDCSQDVLVPALASQGCSLVVTGQDANTTKKQGLDSTSQYMGSLSSYEQYIPRICDYHTLQKHTIITDTVDMSNIPEGYLLGNFDFTWSCGALEHLGNIEKGMQFVIQSLKCLKYNGVAVHTTEFNAESLYQGHDGDTIDNNHYVLFRKSDIENLCKRVKRLGYHFCMIDFNSGSHVIDKYIDSPPYSDKRHLKLLLPYQGKDYVSTCIGFVIYKHNFLYHAVKRTANKLRRRDKMIKNKKFNYHRLITAPTLNTLTGIVKDKVLLSTEKGLFSYGPYLRLPCGAFQFKMICNIPATPKDVDTLIGRWEIGYFVEEESKILDAGQLKSVRNNLTEILGNIQITADLLTKPIEMRTYYYGDASMSIYSLEICQINLARIFNE